MKFMNHRVSRVTVLAGVLVAGTWAGAAPVITEFLARNPALDRDDQGLASDWIEVWNPDAVPVDLSGWGLSDDEDVPGKWTFPAVTLGAGEYLVVRASGLDRRDPGQTLHTNFALSADGGWLGLSQPEGACVSCYAGYPRQFGGVSYGQEAGGGARGWFLEPTPGGENAPEVLSDYVRDTRFSVAGGFAGGPFAVTVSTDTPGAEIRYTTDGSVPDDTSALLSAPLSVSTTTTLRVRAFAAGQVPTNTDTRTWIFPETWRTQPDFPEGFSKSWGDFSGTFKILADYGMNAGITGSAEYRDLIVPAMTTTLPVLCVTGPAEAILGNDGLYGTLRYTDSEVPVAVEYFDPRDASVRFTARAGLQLHGSAVRDFAKKAFRLDFSGEFGEGLLRYPLFPGSAVEQFDQLVLRTGGHDSFTVRTRGGNPDQNDHAFHAGYLRDQFLRRTETGAGLLSPRGRYVHLCINGLYWGLFDLHERPDAPFAADHEGGAEADWDVLHHQPSRFASPQVIAGNDEAWSRLQALVNQPVTTRAAYEALTELLGPDRYVDHLLIRMWAGDHDWLGPAYLSSSTTGTTGDVAVYHYKNWYALRDSRSVAPRFWQFFTWDGEICMGNHLLFRWFDSSPTGSVPVGLDFPKFRELRLDCTGISWENTPAAPWAALSGYPEFQLKVADRAHRLLDNAGALSPLVAAGRVQSFIDELDLPIVAESARWGGVSGLGFRAIDGVTYRTWDNGLLTRNTHWRPETAWLRDTFCVQRGEILRGQLRARGLYPEIGAPSVSPDGGWLAAGSPVSLTNPNTGGVIRYTLDGSDPRTAFTGTPAAGSLAYSGPFVPNVPAGQTLTLRTRVLRNGVWSALTETAFRSGTDAAVPPEPGGLAFTEIHYHPAAPSAGEVAAGYPDGDSFEFLELTNVTAARMDLRGLRFAAGIDFDFPRGSILTDLAPGETLLLVRDAAAFALRYPSATGRIAGVFAHDTGLSNGGERLRLVREDGVVIADFSWDDTGNWPTAADGQGASLHLLAPAPETDPGRAGNWRADTPSPGATDPPLTYAVWLGDFFSAAEIADGSLTGPLADPDGDGLVNSVEFVSRTRPREASGPVIEISFPAADRSRFAWEVRRGAVVPAVQFEWSSDLVTWHVPDESAPPVGTVRGTLRHTVETNRESTRWVRLRAAAP